MKLTRKIACLSLVLALAGATASRATESTGLVETQRKVDNGTDPTLQNTAMELKYEHMDLVNGMTSGTLRLVYKFPLGAKKDYAVALKAPVARITGTGDDAFSLGDMSIKVTHPFGFSPAGAYAVQLELFFDTASRPELGAGKNGVKATFIPVRFLKGGSLFAPALEQAVSFGGDESRADINTTTLDLYYVPKLANPLNFMTYDPGVVRDWENERTTGYLAVTFGRLIGPVFGGNSVLFVKPTVFVGADRLADWGIEVGYKVIGF